MYVFEVMVEHRLPTPLHVPQGFETVAQIKSVSYFVFIKWGVARFEHQCLHHNPPLVHDDRQFPVVILLYLGVGSVMDIFFQKYPHLVDRGVILDGLDLEEQLVLVHLYVVGEQIPVFYSFVIRWFFGGDIVH